MLDRSSWDLAINGLAVRLDMVRRLSLSSSSIVSGLWRCGGTIGVEVAVAWTANEAGLFGEGTPVLKSKTGAECIDKREPSWFCWFIFSSMTVVPTISCDAVAQATASRSTESCKLHSRGNDIFPWIRSREGDRNTLELRCFSSPSFASAGKQSSFHLLHLFRFSFIFDKKRNLRFSNTLYFYLCTCLLGSFSISSSIYLIRCQLLFYLLSSILRFLLFKLKSYNQIV